MKIAVVGPGALGTLFAALLARAGHQLWLLDHRGERARIIAARGIELHEHQATSVFPVQATDDPSRIGVVPLVLLCVKSDAVAVATRTILPCLGPDSLLVAMQNGIAHHQLLSALFSEWAMGITAQGATLLAPGVVRHGGNGPTCLGFAAASVSPPASERLQEVAAMMSQAGIATTVAPDIVAVAWNKLIVNAGINALTALEDCPNGELLARPAALATLKAAVLEAAEVARACGIAVDADPVAMTVDICRQTANNFSSMLQDVRKQRHTEIEAINGAVVQRAQAVGVPVPANEALLHGVRALEAEFPSAAAQ